MIRTGYTNAQGAGAGTIPHQLYSKSSSNVLELATASDRVTILLETARATSDAINGFASRMSLTTAEEFSVTTPARSLLEISPDAFRTAAANVYSPQKAFVGYGTQLNPTNTYTNTRMNINGGLEVNGDLYTTGITQFGGIATKELICRPEPNSSVVDFKVQNPVGSNLFTVASDGTVEVSSNLTIGKTLTVGSNIRAIRVEHPVTPNLNIRLEPDVSNPSVGRCIITSLLTRTNGSLEVVSGLTVGGDVSFNSTNGIAANRVTASNQILVNSTSQTPLNAALVSLRTVAANSILTVSRSDTNLVHWNSQGCLGLGMGTTALPVVSYLHVRSSNSDLPIVRGDLEASTTPLKRFVITRDGYVGIGLSNPIAPIHIHMGAESNVQTLPVDAANPFVLVNNLETSSRPFLVFASNMSPRFLVDSRGALLLGGNLTSGGVSLRSDTARFDQVFTEKIQSLGQSVSLEGSSLSAINSIGYASGSATSTGESSNIIVNGHLVVRPPTNTSTPCLGIAIESGTRPSTLRVTSSGGPALQLQRAQVPFSFSIDNDNLVEGRFTTDAFPRIQIGSQNNSNGSFLNLTLFNQRVYQRVAEANLTDAAPVRIPPSDALTKIKSLEAYQYTRNGQAAFGLLGSQVQTVLPEAVHTDAAGNKTVDQSAIIALLIEAIRQLSP